MAKLASYFTRQTRDNGESFVTTTDDAPEWLTEAIREAHCGDMPDDWTYAECLAACEAIDDEGLNEDSLSEHADSRVDVYTKDRFQWATDHCLGSLYAEGESRAEGLGPVDGPFAVSEVIGRVQYGAIEHIAGTILRAWMEASEDPATEDDE